MKYLLLLLALVASPNLFAQTDNTAPVVWERYKISDRDISFMLPKLPTARINVSDCSRSETRTYDAYAAGAAYQVRMEIRTDKIPKGSHCTGRSWLEDPAMIEAYVQQIRDKSPDAVETQITAGGIRAYKFAGPTKTHVVVPDVANTRVFDFTVTHYADAKPPVDSFIGSLQFSAGTAIEIGEGSPVTLGDRVETPANDQIVIPPPGQRRYETHTVFVARPMAQYTDEARKAKEVGTVRLKVTLLANGAVGEVTTLTELKHGLTDQAVNAARRIVFLPKLLDKRPIDVTVNVDYSFSIY